MGSTLACAHYVTMGSGIRGLSTAQDVAGELRARGGTDESNLVISETGVGSGATAVACGVVRGTLPAPPAPFRCYCHHTGRPRSVSRSPCPGA